MCGFDARKAHYANVPQHWEDFERRLVDIPPGHKRAIADALSALSKDVVDRDPMRSMAIGDVAQMIRQTISRDR